MKLRPLADKVLIERLEAKTKTKGGIVIPDTAQEKPRKGKIIRLGQGKLLEDGSRLKFQVKVGDTILLSSYGGTEIKLEDKEYLIIEESDIMAILA
ncbi:MAG: co-chaperone GroES [Planctomycetes bacterium]|nr:co-chaperone GroES [Planctomycetota bacterium]